MSLAPTRQGQYLFLIIIILYIFVSISPVFEFLFQSGVAATAEETEGTKLAENKKPT